MAIINDTWYCMFCNEYHVQGYRCPNIPLYKSIFSTRKEPEMNEKETRPSPAVESICGTTANSRQVGGSHYKSKIEHWDYVLANDIPYLEAQIIKYVSRWRKKNGLQDLQKAKHFLEKLIEHETIKEDNLTATKIGMCSVATTSTVYNWRCGCGYVNRLDSVVCHICSIPRVQ